MVAAIRIGIGMIVGGGILIAIGGGDFQAAVTLAGAAVSVTGTLVALVKEVVQSIRNARGAS